jgi:hypothetical protein
LKNRLSHPNDLAQVSWKTIDAFDPQPPNNLALFFSAHNLRETSFLNWIL